jgi:hypothetical protein
MSQSYVFLKGVPMSQLMSQSYVFLKDVPMSLLIPRCHSHMSF